MNIVEQAQEEEQEAYDNLPEGIQESERGYQLSENADALYDVYTDIENIMENLVEVI